MNSTRLGETLLDLCGMDERKEDFAAIKELLENLSDNERLDVVRFKRDWVSES